MQGGTAEPQEEPSRLEACIVNARAACVVVLLVWLPPKHNKDELAI